MTRAKRLYLIALVDAWCARTCADFTYDFIDTDHAACCECAWCLDDELIP